VACPKDLQKFSITDLVRVEFNPDRFTVITNVAISRLCSRTTGITDLGPHNTWYTPEPGVDAPESAEGEERKLGLFRQGLINQRAFGN